MVRGNITYSNLSEKDEDMLQIEYGNIILDFGYYEFQKNFKIYIIKNNNWESPISEISFTDNQDVDKLLEMYKQKCESGYYENK